MFYVILRIRVPRDGRSNSEGLLYLDVVALPSGNDINAFERFLYPFNWSRMLHKSLSFLGMAILLT